MEWIDSREKTIEFLKKYKYVLCVILIGVFFMVLPSESKEVEDVKDTQSTNNNLLQSSLEEILMKIDGAGKVSVLLTQSAGEEIIYMYDETMSNSADNAQVKQEPIIITDANRNETGMVRQTISPVYQGAIVVCQGADRASVRLAIVEAVSKVTGLSSNQISVLKMK